MSARPGLAVVLIFALLPAAASWADDVAVIVSFHGAVDDALLARHGGRATGRLPSSNAVAGRLPADRLRALRASPGVAFVEEDVILSASIDPDDPRYTTDQRPNFLLTRCPQAWDVSKGAGVRICVLDTGVRMDHEDLGSGAGGKVKAWRNFTSGAVTDASDGNGHGTHTSGIAGARSNNATGVASAGFDVELAMAKVLDSNGNGNTSWIAAGIDWARQTSGAKVISMSFNGGGTTSMKNAVDAAWAAGLVVVAAAGNTSSSAIDYPGAYPNCLCVASCDSTGLLSSFSNYGPAADIAAPGSSILSTFKNSTSDYAFLNGTSMATPHVAGIVALVWANDPGASNAVVRYRIESTATQYVNTPDGRIPLVNAFAAVTSTASLPSVTVAATDPDGAEAGTDPGTFTFTRTGSTAAPLEVDFTRSGSASTGGDFGSIGTSVFFQIGSATATKTVTPVDDGAIELDETVTVTLVAGALYTVGAPGSATVTIKDNDAPPPLPLVSVAATDADASEPGADPGTFTVTRTGPTAAPLTVKIALGGTAVNGTDYAAIGVSVTIPAGSASVTQTLSVLDDALVEGDETVTMTLVPDATYTVDGSAGSATVTLHDDDTGPSTVPPPTPVAASGGGGGGRCGLLGLEFLLLMSLSPLLRRSR
jgi:thermitase